MGMQEGHSSNKHAGKISGFIIGQSVDVLGNVSKCRFLETYRTIKALNEFESTVGWTGFTPDTSHLRAHLSRQ